MIGGPPIMYQQGGLPPGAIPFNPTAALNRPVATAPRKPIIRAQAPETPVPTPRLTPVKLPSPEALGVIAVAAPVPLPSPEALGITSANPGARGVSTPR
jgi:hypothetical protein